MTSKIVLPASFRDLYAFGEKLPLDLSLSENPLGCSPEALAVIQAVSQADCFDYPDADARQLTLAVSRRFKIDPEMIFFSCGSESLIKLLPQLLFKKGDVVVMPELTFPMFEKAVILAGNVPVFSPMRADLGIDLADMQTQANQKAAAAILCNPNNPTGKVLSRQEILEFVSALRVPVLVDEANIEFGGESVLRDVSNFENLLVLRTFSKGYGLAGLRLGFLVANPELIALLKQASQPFPVTSLTQKAAIAALADRDFMAKTKRLMKNEREFLTKELRARDFAVVESKANNLLVKVTPQFTSSDECVLQLAAQGISVVNGSSFRGLGREFIRVSPRTREVNTKFLEGLDESLKAKGRE